jgi:hypothetical protein
MSIIREITSVGSVVDPVTVASVVDPVTVRNTSLANDTDYRSPRVDLATHSLQGIDQAHHEAHEGSHFFYTDSVTVDSGASQDYLITVPDTTKWPHLGFEIDGTAITSFALYEGADRNGTTLQTLWNNNRNSATAEGVTVHKGTAGGTTDGTAIYQHSGGAATGAYRTSVSEGSGTEIILKQNTKYLLRITSGTNGNLTNLRLEWYEHTNKT